ncbi:MAG: hypothetical protein RBS35_03290, partial [Azonexus sp.]|nr:hypothetical protein [Azonexus sp.]
MTIPGGSNKNPTGYAGGVWGKLFAASAYPNRDGVCTTTSTTMTHTTTPATTNSCEIAGFVSQQNVFDAFIQDDLSRK